MSTDIFASLITGERIIREEEPDGRQVSWTRSSTMGTDYDEEESWTASLMESLSMSWENPSAPSSPEGGRERRRSRGASVEEISRAKVVHLDPVVGVPRAFSESIVESLSSEEDLAFSDDDAEGTPPRDPATAARLEHLQRRLAALDALRAQYAKRDGSYRRRLAAVDRAVAGEVARVALDVRESATDVAVSEMLLANEQARHKKTNETADCERTELASLRESIAKLGKLRRLASARQVAAETITQGALVRAKTATELTKTLKRVTASDLLQLRDESEEWLDDLSRVLHHARQAKSPDPAGLTCVVCLSKPRNVAFFDCGHLATCSDCVNGLYDCPLCRTKIREQRRIFFNDVCFSPDTQGRRASPDRGPNKRRDAT